MRGVAYSYLRFSTPEQAMGDSRRRQLSLAESYARQHNLLLDKGLNFRDLGVSAFRGKNAKDGGLRSFLDAVEHGLVPANSYLLIESLDRLSRDRILEAQALFLQIVSAGVTIVTLIDQRTYSVESLNTNPTDLIISLVYMMRANEESTTKSSRLKAAYATRREDSTVGYHGLQCPGWLKPNSMKTGYVVVPEKAAIIQRIFREAVEGRGLQMIARDLNLECVPMLRAWNQRGKIWTRALIRNYLHSTRVVGTYTPCRGELVNGKIRFMPTDAKLGYYPAIVAQADWDFIHDRRVAWAAHHKCVGRRMTIANVLSRLARCPFCDRAMVLMRTENQNQRYLVCMAWREGRACSSEWVRFPEVEDVFTSDVSFLIKNCPQPQLHVDARRAMLKTISKRLSHLRFRLVRERTAHALLLNTSRPGRTWSQDTEAEMEQLQAERYRLRLDRNYWEDATLSLKLEALRTAVLAEPRDLARVNEKLRALLLKVVIDWESSRVVLHWRHGGHSYTDFWKRRQRGTTRNTTRALDSTKHRPRCLPPDCSGQVQVFEGEFKNRMIEVLKSSTYPLTTKDIATRLLVNAGQAMPSSNDLTELMRKVRRTLSKNPSSAIRAGGHGSYLWSIQIGLRVPN